LRENLAGVRVIKAFDKQDDEIARMDEQSAEVRRYELKAGSYNAFIGPSITLTGAITIAGILFASYYRMEGINAGLAIGEVITIVNYVNQVLGAMSRVPRIFMMWSRANTSAHRIADVMETDESTSYGKETEALDDRVTLEFKDVSFTYPGAAREALTNVSFAIKKGETVGVIGGTGAGKTTLLGLILRLYEPDSGEIILEGRPIADYTREALSAKVTAAMQQYNIFALSVGENIVLDHEHDDSRLGKAAESAQIMNMINKVKDGFGYRITQTGTNISGGQKQRVSTARTLYREGALTVLDDVASALDYKTDLALRTALRTNYRGKSVLIISQRVSAVQSADNILVMDDGMIVGQGAHSDLIASCSAYGEICESQDSR
jgi:ATP-binding cassette subfamily B protein